MPTATDTMTITPASGFIGATVEVDLDALLADPSLQDRFREALWDHLVLSLPQLHPTPAQQVALGRLFGELQPSESYNVAHPEHDEITVFDSTGGYKADQWHCDASWRAEVPMGAVLCMRECPSVGGDTVFTNCEAAYEALSGGMKQLLANRRALHEIEPGSSTEHPVIVAHPVTGKPILFVNRIFTRGISNLPPDESDAILPFLIRHVTRPEFTYRHRWSEGDVVVWDNWATQHYALFDFAERRVVHRAGIAGRTLEAAV
ncbi:MAG: TauD/TfdA family dioxygenase [Acidimicrobiia bacterium]|nr:TauD/TfdA family dioxygenase [Acidimicrobiia bacterium]